MRCNALVAWGVVAALLLTDIVWMIAAGWTVNGHALAWAAVLIGIVCTPLIVRRYREDARLRHTLSAISLAAVYVPASATFSYLVVSTNLPLVDAPLAAMDVALGLDWRAWNGVVNDHPVLRRTLALAYFSGLPQIGVIVIGLGIWCSSDRAYEFLAVYFVAGVLCVILSGIYPAAGPWKFYGEGRPEDLAMLSHFEQLRSGRSFEMFREPGQGLVSMPSFHAMSGVLFVHALRGTLWVFRSAVVLNLFLVLATPTVGGHYFVDVIAGVVLGVILIITWRRIVPLRAGSAAAEPIVVAETGAAISRVSRT